MKVREFAGSPIPLSHLCREETERAVGSVIHYGAIDRTLSCLRSGRRAYNREKL